MIRAARSQQCCACVLSRRLCYDCAATPRAGRSADSVGVAASSPAGGTAGLPTEAAVSTSSLGAATDATSDTLAASPTERTSGWDSASLALLPPEVLDVRRMNENMPEPRDRRRGVPGSASLPDAEAPDAARSCLGDCSPLPKLNMPELRPLRRRREITTVGSRSLALADCVELLDARRADEGIT